VPIMLRLAIFMCFRVCYTLACIANKIPQLIVAYSVRVMLWCLLIKGDCCLFICSWSKVFCYHIYSYIWLKLVKTCHLLDVFALSGEAVHSTPGMYTTVHF